MMKLVLGLFTSFLLCTGHAANAQAGPPCSSFCVTNIYLDTAQAGLLWVTVDFTALDSNTFINYPHIQSMVTPQGDTVGTGDLWFFGQFGNTTQDYPVTTSLASIPDNFEVIIDFHFDTVSCALVFPCMTSIENGFAFNGSITFRPNPFSSETSMISTVELREATLTIFDLHGRSVYSAANIQGFEYKLFDIDLLPGLYVSRVVERGRTIALDRVLVID